MDSVLNPKQTDAQDVAIAAIREAYQQIGHADNQLPHPKEQVSGLEQGAAHRPSNQQKRLAVPGRQPLRDRLALPLRGVIGLLLIARRCGQRDDRELGVAAWPDFITGPGRPGYHAIEPPCRFSVRGRGGTSGTGTPVASGSDGSGRRRANLRWPVGRAGTAARVNGERSCRRGARD